MKKSLLVYLLIISQAALGENICRPTSREMSAYFEQKSWRSTSIQDESGAPAIPGWVDGKNRFHMGNIGRTGAFKAQITIDPDNSGYNEFFKYCSDSDRRRYLRAMRIGGDGNRYKVTLRFLPEIKGYANNPFHDQKFTENELRLNLKIDDTASISTYEVFPDRAKRAVYDHILGQLREQKNFGLIELDFTNWDDLVCDMALGKIEVTVLRSGHSWGPLVEQKVEFAYTDLQMIHRHLNANVRNIWSKEKNIFMASRIMTELERDRRIGAYKPDKLFDVLQRLMTPGMAAMGQIDGADLNCIADQLQSYTRPYITHAMRIDFSFSKLDELQPPSPPDKKR